MMRRTFILLAFAWCAARNPAQAESLTYMQVLQGVLETYPTLQVAALQLDRARQENARVESQLGWSFNAQTGAGRELSIIGAPVDRAEAGAGIDRRLASGGSIGLGANYLHEESSQTLSPLIPNPSTNAGVDLRYRHPLGRGAGNPDYTQGLLSAQAQVDFAEATRRGAYDDIARQVANVFYAAALTAARIENARRAIDRAERLKTYIRERLQLGLAEKKDVLQAEAQWRARRAEHQGLIIVWNQQRTSLNRLMGKAFDSELTPLIPNKIQRTSESLQSWLDEARQHSPLLQQAQAQIALADAAIARRKDAHKDNLDLVFSLGGRTRSGELPAGNDDQTEAIGGVRLEYSRALDQRGLDAELRQALLDRDIAREQQRLAQEDLQYGVASLAAEIDANFASLDGFSASLAAEEAKLSEARERYRQGREETDRLIQFASELSAAEFAAEQQNIDLTRRLIEVDVVRGVVWQAIQAVVKNTSSVEMDFTSGDKALSR